MLCDLGQGAVISASQFSSDDVIICLLHLQAINFHIITSRTAAGDQILPLPLNLLGSLGDISEPLPPINILMRKMIALHHRCRKSKAANTCKRVSYYGSDPLHALSTMCALYPHSRVSGGDTEAQSETVASQGHLVCRWQLQGRLCVQLTLEPRVLATPSFRLG